MALCGLAGWLITRQALIVYAENKAQKTIDNALSQNPAATLDENIISISKEIYKNFHHQDPAEIRAYDFRPYLTNHRLPDWLRLPDGVMEIYLGRGYCDNATRLLSFILKQQGLNAVQWNMVSPRAAHSALLVTMPDHRKVLTDAFYGYIAVDKDGNLTDPQNAQARLKSGENFEDIFVSLGAGSDPRFYQKFDDASMAAQGDDLILTATLPPLNGKTLTLGEIDGDDLDVKRANIARGLNQFWYYIGHKYNREWVRVLKTEKPVQVLMTLVDPADNDILNATPAPSVSGKTLSWNLAAGDTITFRDRDAKLSWKRRNSYIGVDQIIFMSE